MNSVTASVIAVKKTLFRSVSFFLLLVLVAVCLLFVSLQYSCIAKSQYNSTGNVCFVFHLFALKLQVEVSVNGG